MNKFLFLLCALVLAFHFAPAADTERWKQHCAKVAMDPSLFIKNLSLSQNRLSFTNRGGLFNGGVCWWHSRLTRAAQYLAVFDPSEPKVTSDEAYKLVQRLREGRPVTINGYHNLQDFSIDHQEVIQENLEAWQISNGGFGLGFLDGLMGSNSIPADDLKILMDEMYNRLQTYQKPIYQVLQLPGITAHGWLVIGMQPTTNGYKFEVVDSNYYDAQTWNYTNGSTGFFYGSSPFVSYTTNRGLKEEALLTKRLNVACQGLKNKGKLAESQLTIDEELEL
tara:strand:+ start:48625 stop:49461 length:837 start_codon:yes stop_codon:yes gene_type:complete